MRRVQFFFAALSFLPLTLAQSQPQSVQAVGSATVSGEPDQVKVDVGVVTTAPTAQEASAQNATQMIAEGLMLRCTR